MYHTNYTDPRALTLAFDVVCVLHSYIHTATIMNMAFKNRNWWPPYKCGQMEYYQASLMVLIIAVQIFPKTFIWLLESLKSTELIFKILWILKSRVNFFLPFFTLLKTTQKLCHVWRAKRSSESGATFPTASVNTSNVNVWFHRCCSLVFGVLRTKPQRKDGRRFGHVQQRDGANLASRKLRLHCNWQATNLEDQRDLWIVRNRTRGVYEVQEKMLCWMEADHLLEKEKKLENIQPQSKCLCAQHTSLVQN